MYRPVFVLMALGLALVNAQIPNLGWCPDYVPMADFNMDRYLGTWYEQERYFRVMEAGSRCIRTNYTKAVDGRILVASEITGRLSGIKRILDGEIPHLIKDHEARINVKYSSLPYPIEMSYTVLDTDYDTYSVVWSCSGLGPVNTQSAWLMTRERLAPGTVLQKAYGVLDKYKISRTFFVKTDQADCAIAEAAAIQADSANNVAQKSATQVIGAEEEKKKAEMENHHVKPEVDITKHSGPHPVSSDDVHVPVVIDNNKGEHHNHHHVKPVHDSSSHVEKDAMKHGSSKVH